MIPYWYQQMMVDPPEKQYACLDCDDVYGRGQECWNCGGDRLKYGAYVPGWTHSHRHDPSLREVPIGNGSQYVRREVARLLPR